MRKPGNQALIRRLEWIVAIALSVVVLFLLVVRAIHAGALWRDEAESVQSAQMSIAEMFKYVFYTSFPILFPLTVRAYTTLFGASDISLRCFGLAVGIFILGAAWLPLRKLTGSLPMLLPAMIGLNVNFLISGTSLRGYGLGSLFILLAFLSTARLLLNPSVLSLGAVLLAYLVSLQYLFLNVPLILAMLIAAAVVLLIRRGMKAIWFLIGIAIVCGVSYISYLLRYSVRVSNSFGSVWTYFIVAWGQISMAVSRIWLGLIFLSLITAIWRLTTIRKNHPTYERDLLLFGILLIPGAMIGAFAFVQLLPRFPEARYFLALSVVVSATADLIWANFPLWLRVSRIGLTTLAMVTLPFWIWWDVTQAESNVGAVAKTVEEHARPNDLIVVNPWPNGISFNWYYHGVTRWVTVPEMNDHRVHRYDLLQKKMVSISPLADLEEEIAATLKSGNRLWFVGRVELPPPGEAPIQLPPAPDPDPRFGRDIFLYREAWSQEISLFLLQHAERNNLVDVSTGQLVNAHENVLLYALKGWK